MSSFREISGHERTPIAAHISVVLMEKLSFFRKRTLFRLEYDVRRVAANSSARNDLRRGVVVYGNWANAFRDVKEYSLTFFSNDTRNNSIKESLGKHATELKKRDNFGSFKKTLEKA